MVYRKGQRADKRREAEYPLAVDVPMPRNGPSQNLNRIVGIILLLPLGNRAAPGQIAQRKATILASANSSVRT